MKIFKITIPQEVISTVIIIVVSFIIYFIIRGIIRKALNINSIRNGREKRRKKTVLLLIQRIIKYLILSLAVISILSVFHVNTTAIITSVGAASIVAGLALQDLLKDFLVGLTIIFEDSFSIGDIISVNGYKGEVIDLNLKSTKLKALTGEIHIISNRLINEITNFSVNKRLVMIDISTRYEEDIKKVQKVLTDVCKNIPKQFEEIEEVRLEDGIEELGDSAVIYRLSTLVNIKDIYKVKRVILEAVKKEFDDNNISIPYPQLEVHNE